MSEPALEQDRDAPQFKVSVAGSELPVETAVDILEVRASDYVEGAGTFTVTFNNWDSDKQEFKWIDETLFSEGTEIEVKLGYVDLLSSIIKGEVTAIEPEFHDAEAPTLKIHGYDLLHRFRRGRKTRSFVNMKDSQIAEQVARDLNLRAEVDDTQITHEYVLQSNLTDIDFLLERARRINYEVAVKDKTLLFRKAANDKDKVVSLDFGLTLKSFYPRLNTIRQVSEVVVQGWNAMTKEAIVGTARKGDEATTNGTKLGVAISEQAFSSAKTVMVDKPIFSEGEATQIAKGKFNEMADDYITGEGLSIGNTDIRAGAVVELKGLGTRFSGRYYITSSTHTVGRTGYLTRFTVSRNAA
ncbi:MAG TPA: contractile injection system protein, VgrG/Pvc8 family [Pyrinomonadaceae bacterium]|jgi:phage protein D